MCFRGLRRKTRTIRTEWKTGRYPGISIWLITAASHIVLSKILKITCRQLPYPYHLKRVKDLSCKLLLKSGFASADFCHNMTVNIFFLSIMLFIAETELAHDGITNFDNLLSWAYFIQCVNTPLQYQ
jgi:hypothetical protein